MSNKITPYHQSLFAIIDLGSNSFHMLVCRLVAGSVQVVDKVKRKVRLASGLNESLELDQASFARGFECLSFFAERLQDIPKENIRVVATATLRLAKNRDDFIQQADKILGHSIELLSGEQEASNIYLGVAHTSGDDDNRLVLDIGGASTEVIVGQNFQADHVLSLNIGCVTFNQRYFTSHYDEQAFLLAINDAKQVLKPHLALFTDHGWDSVLGGSGTFQAIYEVLVAQQQVALINREALENIKAQVVACGSLEKLEIDGLLHERKPVFASGLAILIALFDSLAIDNLQLSSGALREGLLYELLPNMREMNIRQRTIDSLIRRHCIDQIHAQRVENTAIHCFKKIADKIDVDEETAMNMLKCASKVHEVGLIIEFKKNRQHAVYLLENADLPGISQPLRQALVALVGNYKDDINLSLIAKQSLVKASEMNVLIVIFRLSVVLAKRRKDAVLPTFNLTLKAQSDTQTIALELDNTWCQQHPLIMAELELEKQLLLPLGFELTVNG